jgi:protein-tyrosine phosphatase
MARMPKTIDLLHADDPRDVVHEVVQLLVEGGLVGLPTETVYGIAAYSAHPEAAGRLQQVLRTLAIDDCVLAVKGPYEALDYLSDPGPVVQKLLRRFWPGPVTLSIDTASAGGLSQALPESTRRALLGPGGLELRVPGGDLALAALRLLPAPLLLSGEVSTNGTVFETAAELGAACGDRIDLVVDAGPCKYGAPTSIVHVVGDRWELRRERVVSVRTLNRLAGNLYLFVCTGNTCRSPMAESLFRKMLSDHLNCTEDDLVDRGYFVASAGVSAGAGSPAAAEAVEVLKARGVDLRGHESQPVTSHLLSQADRIFTMTRGHRDVLLREFPEAAGRVSLLARDGSDISDPIGAPIEEYRRCADQIEQHLLTILDELPVN